MTSPNFSILYSAKVDAAATGGSAGDVLIPSSSSGQYVKASTANRGTRRSTGIALGTYVAGGTVEILQFGQIDATTAGLGTGTASWVRVSSAGVLERCTPGAGDDVVGRCETDGTFHACFGVFDSSNYAGGGGGSFTAGGDLSGTSSSQTVEKVKGTTITTAGGALAVGAVLRTTAAGTADWGQVNLADTDAVTGTLPKGNQAAQDMAGDVTGTTAASVVAKVNGTTITTAGGALATGAVLRVTGVASATWGAVDLADTDAVTGVLPKANQGAQDLAGDVTGNTGAAVISGLAVSKLAPGANGEVLQTTGGVTVWGAAPGGGSPGGADTQLQRNNAGAFGGVSGVTTDGVGLTALKIADSAGGQYYTFAVSNLAADRTITLPLLGAADTFVFEAHTQTLTNKTINGASNTLTVRIANDVSGLGAGVATFLATPSGANLASALTTALPDTKGGTGLTALGAGVATMLGTFSSANIKTACTDETGSGGALVFATGPTLSAPVLTGVTRFSGVTTNANTGTLNNVALSANPVLDFTNAAGPTVTGIDATGITTGQMIFVVCSGGTMALNHEDAGSTAANRIVSGSGASVSVSVGMVVPLLYYGSRWHVMATNAI